MALYTIQAVVGTGTTPSVITPTASDTISTNDIGQRGVVLRIVTTGTATNVAVLDPGLTPASNAGTVVPLACPATGVRYLFVGPNSVNQTSGVATLTFSSVTGASVEATRY